MLVHLRVWWRFYFCLLLWWAVQNFIPSLLQGAASELGQTVYGWLTMANDWILDLYALAKWIEEL